jgi:hypothetical protein
MRSTVCFGVFALVVSWLTADVSWTGEASLGFATVAEKPAPTDDVLLNPGMGLFIMPGLAVKHDYERDWYMPIVSVAYFRLDWSMLEPVEGKYRFDEVLGPAMQYWVGRGKRVALRVISSNMHSRQEYVTPKWVFDAGVPGVPHKGLYVDRQVDPPFWHPLYMKKQAAFIAALGKKYNGMKGLEFVDIGAVGEWGESHLMRWSDEDREKTGYTRTEYTKAYLRFNEFYRQAFPDTPVALNCAMGGMGHNDVIVNDAVRRGIWLRQDGLKPDYPRTGTSSYYHQYAGQVKTLYELCYGYKSMASRRMTAKDTFQRGLEDPISYLNLMGADEVAQLPEVDREACRMAARDIGYRLVPVLVERNANIQVDRQVASRLWTRITWRNLGVAPCYQQLAIELTLTADDGRDVFCVQDFPAKPTTLWQPKEDIVTALSFALPASLAPGRYVLKVALVDPFQKSRRILLPLNGRDSQGRYPLCTITAIPRGKAIEQPQVPKLDPASPASLKRWTPARGMTLSWSDPTPDGRPSLKMEGKTGVGWQYCSVSDIAMLPATEYVLSARMKVVSIADPKRQPCLKVGLQDAAGKWIANKLTSRYDTSKLGTWQELRGRFVTESQTAGAHLAVEKSDNQPAEATIIIGDVRLEAVSAP